MSMDSIKEFFNRRDRFAKFCGMELVELSEGRAKARMVIADRHLNGVDTCQGGVLFTLADFVFAAACNSYGTIAVAANASISFFHACRAGETIWAEAEEVSKSRKLGHYLIRLSNGEGKLLAQFQGMAYRKEDALPLGTASKS